MTTPSGALYDLIVEIRGGFHDLKAVSDAMLAGLGITAAMRAVLEHVEIGGAATVPQIARAKSVTRQHIQQLADALVAGGLAQWHDNPGHKRSRLLAPSDAGHAAFAEIRRREAAVLEALAAGFGEGELAAAVAALRRLRGGLQHLDGGGGAGASAIGAADAADAAAAR